MCNKTIVIFVKYNESFAVVGPDNESLLEIVAGGAGIVGTRGTQKDLFRLTGCPVIVDWTRVSDFRTRGITKVSSEE